MLTYKLVTSLQDGRLCAVARSDGWQIPIDTNSAEYQQYLKWLAEGNEPLPADEQGTQP